MEYRQLQRLLSEYPPEKVQASLCSSLSVLQAEYERLQAEGVKPSPKNSQKRYKAWYKNTSEKKRNVRQTLYGADYRSKAEKFAEEYPQPNWENLDPTQKQIVYWYYGINDRGEAAGSPMTVRAIAQQLGISHNAAHKRLKTCRGKLSEDYRSR